MSNRSYNDTLINRGSLTAAVDELDYTIQIVEHALARIPSYVATVSPPVAPNALKHSASKPLVKIRVVDLLTIIGAAKRTLERDRAQAEKGQSRRRAPPPKREAPSTVNSMVKGICPQCNDFNIYEGEEICSVCQENTASPPKRQALSVNEPGPGTNGVKVIKNLAALGSTPFRYWLRASGVFSLEFMAFAYRRWERGDTRGWAKHLWKAHVASLPKKEGR